MTVFNQLAKIGGFAAIFAYSGSPTIKKFGLTGLLHLPTNCDIIYIPLCQSLSNMYSMEYALKSVSDLAYVGVPHGDGDGP